MTTVTRDDLLHLIATRHEMIEPLCDGELEKRRIEETLDVSRPTVDRAFRELEELGLLESRGTTYELTRFGRLFCDRFDAQISQLDEMVELASILSHLPESAAIGERMLSGAQVKQTQKHAPLSPISSVGRLAASAEKIEGYTNVILPHYVTFIRDRVLENGLDARIILSEGVMKQAFAEYADEINELIEANGTRLVKTHEDLPYGIVVLDDEIAGVSIRDEENRLRGVLVNYSDSAVDWAKEQLDELESGGERYEFTRRGTRGSTEESQSAFAWKPII